MSDNLGEGWSKDDQAYALANETCPTCGVLLGDHYRANGTWKPCNVD